MDDPQHLIAQMRAITISREYGSGGGEIAKRLASRLGWRLVDHEIVAQVARELDIPEEEAEVHDEHADSLVSYILTSLRTVQPALFTISSPMPPLTDLATYHETLKRVVKGAVAAGHVVIVGRGSQVLLAKQRNVLHIRIVAPLEQRLVYVMRREGLSRADAEARIQFKDQGRMRYLQSQYHKRPDDAALYDLVINTAVIDLDSAVDLIMLALERKAQRLTVPQEQLGPAAGLSPYPGQPGDITPP